MKNILAFLVALIFVTGMALEAGRQQ